MTGSAVARPTSRGEVRSSRTRYGFPRAVALVASLVLFARPQPAAPAEPDWGRVAGVVDGDTLVLHEAGDRHRVRLFGIDAPEADQLFGPESREALADLVLGEVVEVEVMGTDRFGRVVGVVTRGDTDVNLAMVQNGWAWHAVGYDRRRGLRDAQRAARTAKRGLWADDRPVPPWRWRRIAE